MATDAALDDSNRHPFRRSTSPFSSPLDSVPVEQDSILNTNTREYFYGESQSTPHAAPIVPSQQTSYVPYASTLPLETQGPAPQQPLNFGGKDENMTKSSSGDGRGSEPPPAAASSSTSTLNEKDTENQTTESEKSKGEEEKDPNIVDFDGPDDPYNPQNWPMAKKWLYATVLGLMTLVVTFASSVFSTAIDPTSKEYGVSPEVMVLGQALFVIGFAFGPLIFGPMSELYGRRLPLFSGYIIFIIFQIPVGVAQNLQTIFVCRFFGGVFAAAPLAVVGGQLADFFDPVKRGLAVCVFSGATFIGPVMGPIVGGFITMSHLGWRWTAWITMIMAALFGGIGFFVIPESFAPVLLKKKAVKLRFETKNWAIHAPIEEKQVNFKEISQTFLLRPFAMLFMEPILLLITIYMSFIYGVLYLFFEAYPITFQMQRGYNLGVGALPFISIGIGVVVGASIITWITLTRIARLYHIHGKIIPEQRLIPMIIGGAFLPAGLFWFAWTSATDITPWPQIIAGIPIGAGIQMIFLQGLVYIIDVYMMHANSALAANTFLRSWVGGGLPMAAMPFFKNLGVDWATSTLGFVAIALFPVPVIFYIYGAKIRSWSKYAPS